MTTQPLAPELVEHFAEVAWNAAAKWGDSSLTWERMNESNKGRYRAIAVAMLTEVRRMKDEFLQTGSIE